MSIHGLMERVLLVEAGCSGQGEQVGGSWGGNSPINPEVTVVQQKVEKKENKVRQHSWVLRKQQRVRGRRRDSVAEEKRGSIKMLDSEGDERT